MDARLQRRVQRYGWDLAAEHYEACWRDPLAIAQAELLRQAGIRRGEHVLDIACGTGLVALPAAQKVGPDGWVTGVDLSGRMIEVAQQRARDRGITHARFLRMDAEALELDSCSVDVALCALGLMYMPDPERAITEMSRVLKPGGRMVLAVWGERERCGWSALFPIIDAEVASDVCPLFFRLGAGNALNEACAVAGFDDIRATRLDAPFIHESDDEALKAAFLAGPVALAWSRLDELARRRVCQRYLAAIEPYREAYGHRIPGEFAVLSARRLTHDPPRVAGSALRKATESIINGGEL